jgi:6-phosphofructokinase 1
MEYTRDLGYLAAKFLLRGGNGAMVSVQNGHFVPLRFAEIFDPVTNRTKVRMVDVSAEYFEIARSYMLRLTRDDFGDPHELAKFASTAGISLDEFRDQFYYLIEEDMLYRSRDGRGPGAGMPPASAEAPADVDEAEQTADDEDASEVA